MLDTWRTGTARVDLTNTIFWHDYETWGSNPRIDRPCQFAGIRTDEDLNPVDDPVEWFCRPAPDFLPHPDACLVTGISPQKALEKGLCEAEFSARIAEQFMQPNTCVSGYNSIRFDDEVTRHLFYRSFYDPYEREWKHGNSRWDIIDLVRMTHALRPEGIQWPVREDGLPSFRLDQLTVANGIEHRGAHDAVADVMATIEMAKLVKSAQPRLYDWFFELRHKKKAQAQLDLARRDMVLHVSGMFPASRGCLAVVVPLARHPQNPNGVIVYDLAQDPADWLGLDAQDIAHRLFTPADELDHEEQRVALKTVHINRCPALAPLSVLDEASVARYNIDLPACKAHRERLLGSRGLEDKLRAVFSAPDTGAGSDPDQMLYSGGFFSDGDRRRMQEILRTPPDALSSLQPAFEDARLGEIFFRYRARNYPDTLAPEEQARWRQWCAAQLRDNPAGNGLSAEAYFQRLDELESEPEPRRELFAALRDYGRDLCSRFDVTP